MSEFHKQSENMKALEQSLNDHMEICSLRRQVKRLNAKNSRLKAENARLTSELSNITGWGRGLESDLSHARVEISFLKAEVERLDHQVRYWRIEAEVDNARWLRCLEDLEKLRKDSQP